MSPPVNRELDLYRPNHISELIENYGVPTAYRESVKTLVPHIQVAKNLYIRSLAEATLAYAEQKKRARIGRDTPATWKLEQISERISYDQTVFLREGIRFNSIADLASDSGKPVLKYYSLTMLQSFFSGSMVRFVNMNLHHGLTMKYASSPKDIVVRIENHGKFSRIVDTYTLLGCDSRFNAFTLVGGEQVYVPSKTEFSYTRQPSLTLPQISALRRETSREYRTHTMYQGFERDLLDYILLFAASNLARYRPSIWKEILDGEKSDYIVQIRSAMDRVSVVTKRLVFAVEAAFRGDNVLDVLVTPDSIFEENDNYDSGIFHGWWRSD
jgi:hypothetical protein